MRCSRPQARRVTEFTIVAGMIRGLRTYSRMSIFRYPLSTAFTESAPKVPFIRVAVIALNRLAAERANVRS